MIPPSKLRIEKTLSQNDLGLTGGHQAGIHVPKDESILSCLPKLNPQEHNPRKELHLEDSSDRRSWSANLIYYNNIFRGGTRNEYRITGLTAYMRSKAAAPGNILFLERIADTRYIIGIEEQQNFTNSDSDLRSTTVFVSRSWINRGSAK
jgi:hypothetical protein